jgi:hypothetical protein
MGFLEVLTAIFIVLKLMGIISWSWWLVLLPVIVSATFYIIVLIGALIASFSFEKRF